MSISPSVSTPLPQGWKRTQLRRLIDIRNGRDYKEVEILEGGYPVYGSGGEFRRASNFLHDGESILFGRKGTVDRPLYVDGKFWTVDTMYYAVPFEHVCARFLYYFSTTIPFKYYVTSTALPSITQSDLAAHPVDLPPLDEQQAIADYLDRETQKIDELITEQRGLIETLRERRRSLVTRLVTRGLDRHADMTEVSSKWLDFVPASWRLTRFRFVATIGNVMVDPKVGDVMHDVLIAPNHVERNTGRLLAIETADAQGADSSKYRVKSGQIVYSKIRPTLNKAVTAPCDCLCSADMYPISFDSDRVSNRYALYQMLSRPIHDYVTERSMRVKMPKVNREELADLPWLLPPFDVQEAISDEIDEQTSRIDEIISESEDLIALSQERRAALITAAVTGQIDVRTAA